MPTHIFLQNTIAVVWDFDKTLTKGYMQEPLFKHYNVSGQDFWKEVNALPEFHKKYDGLNNVSKDTIYLNHILEYVRQGKFKGLSNEMLRKFGASISFYPGIPTFFKEVKEKIERNRTYKKHEIKVEHYIVSTGLTQIILGSKIRPYVEYVWGCEFVETIPGPGYLKSPNKKYLKTRRKQISGLGYVIDNTTKTRAIFEINKGSNKQNIDVNASMDESERRVPFQNMIYIADGPSDVPVFSLVKRNGGKNFAVYRSKSDAEFKQVNELQRQGRIHAFGEADYRQGKQAYMWIMNAVTEIADRIARDRSDALTRMLGTPPSHIIDSNGKSR